MLRSLLTAYERFDIDDIVICYDPPPLISNQIRYEIVSNYKNRKKDPETENLFSLSLSLARSFFYKAGIKQVTTIKYEADDILHYYSHKIYRDSKCLILTNDHDLFQILVPNRVKILKIGSDYSLYSSSDFRRDYKISPQQYKSVLALGGCSTDNVKGVPGISSETALKLIQEFNSIKNLISNYKKSSLSPRIINALSKEESLSFSNLLLSLKLVSLYGLSESLESDLLINFSKKSPEIRYKQSLFLLSLLNFKSFLTESGRKSLKSLIFNL
jgi:5'-3' exonuclease